MSHPPWSYDLAGSASPKLGANPNWWGKLRVPRAARPSTTPRDPRDSKFTPARVPAMCPTPACVTPTDSGARSPAQLPPPGSTGLKVHPADGASHVPTPSVGNTNRQRRAQPSHPPRRRRAEERVRGVTPTIRIQAAEHVLRRRGEAGTVVAA